MYNENSYDIVCPYCFKRFTDYRTLFVDSKRSIDTLYSEYAEYVKYFLGIESPGMRKMPVLFTKDINDGTQDKYSAVTESGDITFTRACPYCCNLLPASAGKVKTFSIAVIGADDANRSFYIASVLHKLNREMQSRFAASFMPADHKTAVTFYEQYDEPLYASHIVPEAMGSIVPLIYDFRKTGSQSPEEWKGSEVHFNRALVYIYNINKDLCDRYPMIAYTALSQVSALVFVSDFSRTAGGGDSVSDPWLGYLTDTINRIYGSMTAEIPTAIVLDRADKAKVSDRKWGAWLKSYSSKVPEKVFPEKYYSRLNTKISAVLRKECPSFSSAVSALFAPENTMFFPVRAAFERHDDRSTDICDSTDTETSFLWLMSKLRLIGDDSVQTLRLKK